MIKLTFTLEHAKPRPTNELQPNGSSTMTGDCAHWVASHQGVRLGSLSLSVIGP
jgi:hypothetical protein